MQREILFRGEKLYDGSWEYGFLSWSDTPRGRSYFVNNNIVDPETVGQFTGMTDKNGTKIFEGDIYNMGDDNIRYVIVWRNCMFIGKQVGNNSYAGLDYWESEIKKVGNIYDNKELLK